MFGSTATVTVDALRVRGHAGLDAAIGPVLHRGDEVFVVAGAVNIDGYYWYEVTFAPLPGEPVGGHGWLAGATADGLAPSWHIEIHAPDCPDVVDAAVLAGLVSWAIDSCGVQVGELTGIVDFCQDGPVTPYVYEPGWLWFSCTSLRSDPALGTGDGWWWYSIYTPPGVVLPVFERGDIVRLTGQIGFDLSLYTCDVAATEPGLPVEFERQWWSQLECPNRFIVSSATIEGHVDLPPI